MTTGTASVSQHDLYLYNNGELFRAYRAFGAHPCERDGEHGTRFAVWAPHAREVRVAGDFNGWRGESHPLNLSGTTGVWQGFYAGIGEGAAYKYEIVDAAGRVFLKSDPFAFFSELRPGTASVVTNLDNYSWGDHSWQERWSRSKPYERPMLIYEVHVGSWRIDGPELFWSYERLAHELVDYVADNGYTHIELLPITEHPFDRSWGYQTTGYYSATSRYGHPDGLKKLVDRCHQRGIGVLLDWVPGHFCKDDHGLRRFDGEPLYEPGDWRVAEKPLWGTLAFDFGRPEVQSFLISNALFWMDLYHIDGIRVDAVASMIDLNFDKPPEMHTRNKRGGVENLDALSWIRKLNEVVFRYYPDALVIAEDSSAWPGVTAPVYLGGLGFNYKWNMGWMNDMLKYMETDPAHRPGLHNLATFSMMYAYAENYVLPLSHDEVVHGKRSLLNKMPGAYEQKFANLRLFYGYWMTHPGKKLLFMGGEFGQYDEWKDLGELDWPVLQYPLHDSMRRFTRDLGSLYRSESALWEQDHSPDGFKWIDADNAAQSVLSYIRFGKKKKSHLVAVCNFSAAAYPVFRLGVPTGGWYRLALSSDAADYGGSGAAMPRKFKAERIPMHGQSFSMEIVLPPLTFLLFEPDASAED
ncbi:1,4-alpha-glucan branching protein GlgB [Cohnella sp. GCM10020058]|uniref:1,4-alpha-glucan branching protein GlgB n=1 Tax=Cohnella sp. GCM10020058 TaxID=3317330 RepID=UPI003631B675